MRNSLTRALASIAAVIAVTLVPAIGAVTPLQGPASGYPQRATLEADFSAGINRLQVGDFYGALLALKDVVDRAAAAGDDAMVARAHAYRAVALVGLDQQERARESVRAALAADPDIVIDAEHFGPVVAALSASARGSEGEAPEGRGQAAEQAGRFQDAFLAYLAAYRALPEVPAAEDDQRLRERIINAVLNLGAAPAIPPAARAHLTKADDLVAADALLGGSGGPAAQQAAAAEFRRAVRIAPWWPEALLKLATVQQKLGRIDEALVNLNLYRLADPDGYLALYRPEPANAAARAPTEPPAARPAGPAVLYVYWLPTRRTFFNHKPKAICDGQHVGNLANGHYLRLSAPPGYHTLKVSGKELSMIFEADRAYYVRLSIEGFPARLTMRLTPPDEGADEIRRRGIVINEPKHTFSAECNGLGATAESSGRYPLIITN